MKSGGIAIVVSFLALCPAGWETVSAAAPQPVYTSQTRFGIPYRFDPAEMKRMGAKEILLYLSTDRGGHWRAVQTVSPSAGRFPFEVPTDGEYWFSVRTIDARNQLHPRGPIRQPGLIVVVDQQRPSLQLRLSELESGRLHVAWSAEDYYLDLRTLKMEYHDGGYAWQPINVAKQAQGQIAWTIPQGGAVTVRGEVRDFAGNLAEATERIRLTPVAAPTDPSYPVYREPIAQSPNPGPPTHNASLDRSRQRYPDFASTRSTTGLDWAQTNPTGPVGPERPNPAAAFPPPFAPAPHAVGMPNEKPKLPHKVVNKRTFNIGYEVDDVGPSGVSRVELFITQNNGLKWYRYGSDDDRQSPFEVQVPREGTYGFKMRVQSGVGYSNDPPAPGDKPDLYVIVDQQRPVAQLLPVEAGINGTNQLAIRYRAQDEYLANRPIALSYSRYPRGPWQPITGWTADHGRYVWNLGPGVPPRFYLQLSVRDAAGNTQTVVSPDPVVIDLSQPSARIINVD